MTTTSDTNARELYIANGDGTYRPSSVFYCSSCNVTWSNRCLAEDCCKPNTCDICKDESPRGWKLCHVCHAASLRERAGAKHAAATKVRMVDYDVRMVYAEDYDEYVLTSEITEWLEEKRKEFEDRPERIGAWEPPMVFGCYEERYLIDADVAIEHALDDAFEDADEHVSSEARKELDEFLTAWSRKNLPTGYMVDYNTALILEGEGA